MLLDLEIREGTPIENAVAELVGCRINIANLQFSRGWQHRCCYAYPLRGLRFLQLLRILLRKTKYHILFEANNGRSALSISIDPREEDSDEEYNPDEPSLSPATLKIVWFDPSQDADQETQHDYCEMSLHVGEVAGENELLKYDESEHLLMAGISPAGFDTLFSKLKEVRAEENRPSAEIKAMALVINSSLGFLPCRQGWVHEEEGGIEVNYEEDFGIRMGIYDFVLLCKRIFTAEEVGEYKMFFHI